MEGRDERLERRIVERFKKGKVVDADISIRFVGNIWCGSQLYEPQFMIEVSEVQREIGNPSMKRYKLRTIVRGDPKPNYFYGATAGRRADELKEKLETNGIQTEITRDDINRRYTKGCNKLTTLQGFWSRHCY